MRRAFLVFIFIGGGWPAALFAGSTAETTRADSPQPVRVYEVSGVLQSVDVKNKTARIAHDEIAGYMGAMTMNFAMRDEFPPVVLAPGDRLTFRLCVTADEAWIEGIHKTGSKAALVLTPAVNPNREFKTGDSLPDIELLTQSGEKIHLGDFRSRVLAITFIYTRCPLPTYCPLMNRNFQATQSLLDRLEDASTGHFLSLSLDPLHDTPAVLAAYATLYQANSRRWTFASASEEAVRSIGGGVGLEFARSGDNISHNLRTVVIDGSGRIRHVFSGNSWTAQELAAEMRAASRPLR